MAEYEVTRKLTTILAADVAGYTRLMRANEEAGDGSAAVTRRTFLVVFVFIFSLLQAQIADAAASEARVAELFVLIPALETSGSTSAIQLLDEGFIFRGSKVRLGIRAIDRGEISLSYRNPSGQTTTLLHSAKLAAGDWLSVPSDDKWFTIDGEPGAYTVILAFGNGRQVTRSLNVLAPSSPPAELLSVGSKSTQAETFEISLVLPDPHGDELLVARDVRERADAISAPHDLNLRGAAADLYKRVAPGVVVVVVAGGAIGSGSIISADGNVITNWHVIRDHPSAGIYFKPPGQGEIAAANRFEADVIKVDEVADLALLKLRAVPRGYPVLSLASMSDVDIAMDVHAVGHPLRHYWTYTRGTVSQVRKDYQWITEAKEMHSAEVIQTQTPINPGNSGGPLFSDAGKIIGVNSLVSPDSQGMNFAVSVGQVKKFLKSKRDIRLPKLKSLPVRLVPRESLDTDGDGIEDTVIVDLDKNGAFETAVVDKDQDGALDYIVMDKNENGKIDTKIVPTDTSNIWSFDTDEDGQFDVFGVDKDKDGKLDSYQHLQP